MKVGEKVRITGHSILFGWMRELVGQEGEVVETRKNGKLEVVRVCVPGEFNGEPHWFGPAYVERIVAKPERKAG